MALKNKEEARKYAREYRKKYYKANKDKVKQYYQKNREAILEKNKKDRKQYYLDHKEKILEYNKLWNRENRKVINGHNRDKYKRDLKFNLNRKISRGILYSLKENKDGQHWENLVGYTVDDLIKRLKKTMPKGYTWNDYINGKLHIDHYFPISIFNFNKPEDYDFQRCWALKNLRLLPAKENIRKKAKLEKPFQLALVI